MEFINFQQWSNKLKHTKHLIIAGPCAAETKKQVFETAKEISKNDKVQVYRAGIWKPRTTPDSFEGVGEKALPWLNEIQQKTQLLTCVEIATPKHVEKCLTHNIDILWIGARTTSSPFAIQEIANCLKGVDVPVMIKNPINPDLKLWIGAIKRLYKSGIKKIAAIHRGFFPFEDTKYRNIPKWEIMIELKTKYPKLQIINDPSHIAGNRNLVQDIAEMAANMNVNGLMLETHINPQNAKSDAQQQLTPKQLAELLDNINFKNNSDNNAILTELEQYRHSIDSIDYQLIELLSARMGIIKKIGIYKNKNNISAFQLQRWKKMTIDRLKAGKDAGLDEEFVKKILQIVHNEALKLQLKTNKKI